MIKQTVQILARVQLGKFSNFKYRELMQQKKKTKHCSTKYFSFNDFCLPLRDKQLLFLINLNALVMFNVTPLYLNPPPALLPPLSLCPPLDSVRLNPRCFPESYLQYILIDRVPEVQQGFLVKLLSVNNAHLFEERRLPALSGSKQENLHQPPHGSPLPGEHRVYLPAPAPRLPLLRRVPLSAPLFTSARVPAGVGREQAAAQGADHSRHGESSVGKSSAKPKRQCVHDRTSEVEQSRSSYIHLIQKHFPGQMVG